MKKVKRIYRPLTADESRRLDKARRATETEKEDILCEGRKAKRENK